jgi:peroxiredoxin
MNRRFAIVSAAFALLAPLGAFASDAPPRSMLAVGNVAPDFVSHDLAGAPVKISDYRGKILILDFWATWCSPCIASMPHTQEIAAKYAGQGVAVLAVCTGDKRKRFEDWVKLKAKTYPAMRFTFDPHEQGTPAESGRASFALYGVPAIPTQFVIDRQGTIVATTDGYTPGDTRLEAGLAKAGIKVEAEAVARAVATQARLDAAHATNPLATRVAPPAFTEDAIRLKNGDTMTDLTLHTPEGKEQKTSAYRGHPLILCFSPAEMIPTEFLDQAVAKYGAHGVQVLALVTRDSAESYRGWLELHRGQHMFAVAFDPAGPTAVRESAAFLSVGMIGPMPYALVLDREGKLVGKVAPKVATSPRGLAELLRRCGVPVKPEDLPTPDMFPKPAAAPAKPATSSS